MNAIILIFLPFFLAASQLDEWIGSLIEGSSIIKSERIVIDDYPNAYNPSLIEYGDGFLLSFRYTGRFPINVEKKSRKDFSFIGLVKLDRNLKVLQETAQLLPVEVNGKQSLSAEDARLFKKDKRVFTIFNDLPPGSRRGYALYFGELVEKNGIFSFKEPIRHLSYSQARPIEKNWSPFWSDDKLFLIYSDQPRVILEVNTDTGQCIEAARSVQMFNWELGPIRGSTPALLTEKGYFTFFHSSLFDAPSGRRVYFVGAYLFDPEPPFAIRSFSPCPIGQKTDYTDENRGKVIFPAGLVIQDQRLLVAWGKGDKRIMISTYDKEKLFSFLQQ